MFRLLSRRRSGISIPSQALENLVTQDGAVGFLDKKGSFVVACKELPDSLELAGIALKMIESSLRNEWSRKQIENGEMYFSVDPIDGSLHFHTTLKGFREMARVMGLKGDDADIWIEKSLIQREQWHTTQKGKTRFQRWKEARRPRQSGIICTANSISPEG